MVIASVNLGLSIMLIVRQSFAFERCCCPAACGREIRRLRLQNDPSGKARKYREKAQELYDEMMTGHMVSSPIQEGDNRRAMAMALSSMIYVECQAHKPDSALAVYDQMKDLGFSMDKWAASGG